MKHHGGYGPYTFERVLRNLLYNAIEHGESRPIDVYVVQTPRIWLLRCATTVSACLRMKPFSLNRSGVLILRVSDPGSWSGSVDCC